MSAQDAMFLHVEDDVTPMHIGGVSIFEGPGAQLRTIACTSGSPATATTRTDGRWEITRTYSEFHPKRRVMIGAARRSPPVRGKG